MKKISHSLGLACIAAWICLVYGSTPSPDYEYEYEQCTGVGGACSEEGYTCSCFCASSDGTVNPDPTCDTDMCADGGTCVCNCLPDDYLGGESPGQTPPPGYPNYGSTPPPGSADYEYETCTGVGGACSEEGYICSCFCASSDGTVNPDPTCDTNQCADGGTCLCQCIPDDYLGEEYPGQTPPPGYPNYGSTPPPGSADYEYETCTGVGGACSEEGYICSCFCASSDGTVNPDPTCDTNQCADGGTCLCQCIPDDYLGGEYPEYGGLIPDPPEYDSANTCSQTGGVACAQGSSCLCFCCESSITSDGNCTYHPTCETDNCSDGGSCMCHCVEDYYNGEDYNEDGMSSEDWNPGDGSNGTSSFGDTCDYCEDWQHCNCCCASMTGGCVGPCDPDGTCGSDTETCFCHCTDDDMSSEDWGNPGDGSNGTSPFATCDYCEDWQHCNCCCASMNGGCVGPCDPDGTCGSDTETCFCHCTDDGMSSEDWGNSGDGSPYGDPTDGCQNCTGSESCECCCISSQNYTCLDQGCSSYGECLDGFCGCMCISDGGNFPGDVGDWPDWGDGDENFGNYSEFLDDQGRFYNCTPDAEDDSECNSIVDGFLCQCCCGASNFSIHGDYNDNVAGDWYMTGGCQSCDPNVQDELCLGGCGCRCLPGFFDDGSGGQGGNSNNPSYDRPDLGEIGIKPHVKWYYGVPSSSLTPMFETPPGYLFWVEWYSMDDGDEVIEASSGPMEGFAALQFTLEEGGAEDTFALDREIWLRVSVYINGVNLGWESSDEPFKAVQIPHTLEITRGEATYLELEMNAPFGCPSPIAPSDAEVPCFLKIQVHVLGGTGGPGKRDVSNMDGCEEDFIAVFGDRFAGVEVPGILESSGLNRTEGDTIYVPMGIVNSNFYWSEAEEKMYALEFEFSTSDGRGGIWHGIHRQQVSVRVKESEDRPPWNTSCSISNAGWVYTPDGLKYQINRAGYFTFLQFENYVKVEIETKACVPGGSQFCVCGVVVYAGQDVCMVNRCGSEKSAQQARYDNEHVLECVQSAENANNYYAILPNGAKIDVQTFPAFPSLSDSDIDPINVIFHPHPSDIAATKGLCGNFNGDASDDFSDKDGNYVGSAGRILTSAAPTAFLEAWEILDSNQKVLYDYASAAIPPWSDNGVPKYCVGASCFSSQFDLCGGEVARRKRRSIHANRKTSVAVSERSSITSSNDPIEELLAEYMVNRKKRQLILPGLQPPILCEEMLNTSCPAFIDLRVTDSMVDKLSLLDACDQDVLDGLPDIVAVSTCSLIENIVNTYISRDKGFLEEFPGEAEDIRSKICPSSCGGQGLCENKRCDCNEGFTSRDCMINGSRKVEAAPAADVLTPDTTAVGMSSPDGFSQECMCRFIIFVITGPGEKLESGTIDILAVYITFEFIECVFPTSARRRRSTHNVNNDLGTQYSVSVSNDGAVFSDPVNVYSVDTNCLNVTTFPNGSFSAILLPGFCIIDGECQTNGTINPGDSCQFCWIENDVYQWFNDNETARCQPTTSADEDEGLEGYVIAVIVLASLFGVWALAATAYLLYRHFNLAKLVFPEKGLFDTPARDKFTLRKEQTPTINRDELWYDPKGPNVPELKPSLPAVQTPPVSFSSASPSSSLEMPSSSSPSTSSKA